MSEEKLSTYFVGLYKEFISYLNQTNGTSGIVIMPDNRVIIDFQLNVQSVDFEILRTFNNYQRLLELLKKKGYDKDEKSFSYGLFAYKFAEIYDHLNDFTFNKLSNTLTQTRRESIDRLNFREDLLGDLIINAVCPKYSHPKTGKSIILFDNIKIDAEVKINNYLSIIPISEKTIKETFYDKYSGNLKDWEKVTCGILVDEVEYDVVDLIPILGALLRMFNPSSTIKYRSVYFQTEHYYLEYEYKEYTFYGIEKKYKEHTPEVQSKNWKPLYISTENKQILVDYLNNSLGVMKYMIHSAKIYNMIPSSDISLRIPLLFFVIESFFSDIDSEVVFRTSLYVTKILNKDDNFFKQLKICYGIRSKIAHGDLINAEKLVKKLDIENKTFNGAYRFLNHVVIDLWHTLINEKWEPNKSSELIKKYLF